MQRKVEGKSGLWGVAQPGQPGQSFIHGPKSQANCIPEELSALQLVLRSVLGTENRECGVLTTMGLWRQRSSLSNDNTR